MSALTVSKEDEKRDGGKRCGSILSEIPVCNAFNLPGDGWQRQAAYGDRLQKTTQ